MKRYWRTTLSLVLALIFVVTITVTGCSITNWTWVGMQAAAMEVTAERFTTQEGYSMLVLYLREGNYFFMVIRGTHDFRVEGNKLYVDDDIAINKVDEVGWGLYPEQRIEIPMEWDEELQMDVEVPITLEELNLRDFTTDDLPRSGHFARLDDIHPNDAKKAEVSRYYNDQWFTEIRCLVTLQAYQAYQAGDLVIGDYVWIYYSTDPRPGHEHETVPIVVDKIVYP